jgi:hypothetical protein
MNQDILLSKIVPNATETTWTQAYTTLNVYITLSIEREGGKGSVIPYGKELLEKLQREFFALDDKSLENIKKAVGNVSQNIEDGYSYSILVGAIVGDVLYIVIASQGQVIIKRQGKIGVIATGIENELHGFSGKLQHDDIVVFETGDFSKKIPLENISEYLSSTDVSQIAENITPLVHESSKGTEGAIILQYKDLSGIGHSPHHNDFVLEEEPEVPEAVEEQHENKNIAEHVWTTPPREDRSIKELSDTPKDYSDDSEKKTTFPFITLPAVSFSNKKLLIVAAVVLLVLGLGGSIFFQVYKKGQTQKEAEFQKIIAPIQSKFDEGTNLENLNKSLALEDFTAVSKMIDDALPKYSKGSPEYQKLTELKQKVDGKISGDGGGSSAKNVKDFLKTGDKLKSITAITNKGGALLVLDHDGKQVAIVSTDGKIKKTYGIDENASYLSSDDKFIYAMGGGVTSIDKGNGNTQMIVKNIKGSSFDIFGSNIYTLTDNDILKYKAPSYEGTSYFTDKPNFKNPPQDISISGPIWVLESGGTVERFTKGKNDDISLSGLAGPIADGAKIYADPDNNNVYIMDVKNQRVVVFNEKGEYQTQYEGSFIKDGTSFAIDEKNKKGYVLSEGTIYSFDL